MQVNLKLKTQPKPLKRARTTVRGGYVRTYYNNDDKLEMEELRIAILSALNNLDKEIYDLVIKNAKKDVPISLSLVFGFSFPKSYTVKKKNELLGQPHTLLPDLDNLIKNVLDRGNGILWQDDNFIYKIEAKKIYSVKPRIELEIDYKE